MGSPVDRFAGTHGRPPPPRWTGWLLTHGGADQRARRWHRAQFRRAGIELPHRAGRDFVIEGDEYDSAFFDKTEVPRLPPDIADQQRRVRSRWNIYADFDADAGVPPSGEPRAAARPCAHRRQPGARALLGKAVSRVQTFGTGDDVEWQARPNRVRRGDAPLPAARLACRSGVSSCLVGAYNVRNATAATRLRPRSASAPSGSPRAPHVCRRQAAPRDRRRGRRRHGLRRLRPPSDRRRGDAGRAARVESRRADLGRLRTAIRVLLLGACSG